MSKQQLPNKIINFNSADKEFHQKPDEDDIANFPSPALAVLFGNVNCGKRTSSSGRLLFMKELFYTHH